VFTTEKEMRMAACNVYHVLRLFGITLESKREFSNFMGEDILSYIYFSSDNWVNLDADTIEPHPVCDLRDEYDTFQCSNDDRSKQFCILSNLLRNIIYKCVGHRDGLWVKYSKQFKEFDLANPSDILPLLTIIERKPYK
jgi:hypothetical protein